MNDRLIHETSRAALSQGAGAVVSKGFATLMTGIGIPQAAILTPLVKDATIGLMNSCYDDVMRRALSASENEKVNLVTKVSLQTFMELAEKDGVTFIEMQVDEGQLKYAYEVSEDLLLTAIRQSERKKVEVLGRYYGNTFYKGNIDWQDMHQIITMAGALTFRQIALIRLICEGFEGINPDLFITNPSACVEINRMQDYGLWMTEMAMFKDDASAGVQLKMLKPTEYAKMVMEALMLEKLSEDDLKRTIDSLRISNQGEPAEGITKEDYMNPDLGYYDESNEAFVVGGKKRMGDLATSPEDMTAMMRGKDLMRTAADNSNVGEMMNAIDAVMNALTLFRQCQNSALRQPAIEDALAVLFSFFEECDEYGGLRILIGKREEYESILGDLKGAHLNECRKYLSLSKECEVGYDRVLKEKSIHDMFQTAVDNAK